MKVSIDFDGTLDQDLVQIYVQDLIKRGIDVWIVTARYAEGSSYRPRPASPNGDVRRIAKKVGIPEDKIVYTEMEPKWTYLKNEDFVFHLDDAMFELEGISKHTKTVAINVGNTTWMAHCEKLLTK